MDFLHLIADHFRSLAADADGKPAPPADVPPHGYWCACEHPIGLGALTDDGEVCDCFGIIVRDVDELSK